LAADESLWVRVKLSIGFENPTGTGLGKTSPGLAADELLCPSNQARDQAFENQLTQASQDIRGAESFARNQLQLQLQQAVATFTVVRSNCCRRKKNKPLRREIRAHEFVTTNEIVKLERIRTIHFAATLTSLTHSGCMFQVASMAGNSGPCGCWLNRPLMPVNTPHHCAASCEQGNGIRWLYKAQYAATVCWWDFT
jgi:hypothetical protein